MVTNIHLPHDLEYAPDLSRPFGGYPWYAMPWTEPGNINTVTTRRGIVQKIIALNNELEKPLTLSTADIHTYTEAPTGSLILYMEKPFNYDALRRAHAGTIDLTAPVIHTKNINVMCGCGNRYSTSSSLSRHVQRSHQGGLVYCHQCGMSFTDKYHVNSHKSKYAMKRCGTLDTRLGGELLRYPAYAQPGGDMKADGVKHERV